MPSLVSNSMLQKMFIPLLLLAFLLPITASAATPSQDVALAPDVPSPGSELWRAVRRADTNQPPTGVTQIKGVERGILINSAGEDWRNFRMEMLVPTGALGFGLVVAALVLFYLIRGRIRIDGGWSGRVVPRFSINHRVAHWSLAILFLYLGFTGLIMLFGRFALLPVMGPEAFSVLATISLVSHNWLGPLFQFAILGVVALFMKGNGYTYKDIGWFLKGGGMFGGHAPPSDFYNAGEKTWFWLAIFGGILITISGYILDFPIFGQTREVMEVAHIAHAVSAVGLLIASFGHIYIGTAGMEGSIQSMTKGYVDENWAKEHHSIWYDDMKASGKVYSDVESLKKSN